MKNLKCLMTRCCLGIFTFIALAIPASADIIVNMSDDGTDLLVSYSGSIDTSLLGLVGASGIGNFLSPGSPDLRVADAVLVDTYTITITGGAFGSGPGSLSGFNFTGDAFAFSGSVLHLPTSYVSTTPISGSILYPGTIATFDIFPSTVYTIGATGQTITVQHAPVVIPEQSSLALFGISIAAGLGVFRLTRRSRKG